MEVGLKHYNSADISGYASLSVSDSRRVEPSGACIHTTSGTNSQGWLLGGSAVAGTPASTNELISRDGTVSIICPAHRYPYHAGTSKAKINGRWYVNNALSEILYAWELESAEAQAPTYEQVDSLAERIIAIATRYGWRWPFVILGHYGIALPPGRRADPYGLDWGMLMGRLYLRARNADIPGLLHV